MYLAKSNTCSLPKKYSTNATIKYKSEMAEWTKSN